jgi:hypothetical protein
LRYSIISPTQNEKKNNQEVILIAFSEKKAAVLQRTENWYIDGCFSIAPRNYLQILSINGFDPISDLHVPCCWAIMNSKTANSYFLLFNNIVTHFKVRYSIDLEKKKLHIITDMERALKETLSIIFQNMELESCYIHFIKAL